MNETYRKSKSALYNGIEIIKEKYISLVNEFSKTYKDIIKRVVYKKISSMPEEKIELVIDEYFINDLKLKGHRHINQKAAEYEFILENLDKRNNTNQNTNSSIKIFESDIERNNRAHLNFLDEVNNEFKRTLINKISNYYNVFYGVNDYNFEKALDDISHNLASELQKIGMQLEEKYQKIEKEQMKKVSDQIVNTYDKKSSLKEGEIILFEQIANYNGYHIKEENGKYYAINDKEKQQLNLEEQNGQSVLVTNKRDLAFKLGDNFIVSANKAKDMMIVIQPTKFYMCKMNRENSIIIDNDIEGLKIYYNNEEITEEKKQLEVLEEIKNKCPAYYEEILNNSKFNTLKEETARKEDIEELKEMKEDINSLFYDGPKQESSKQNIDELFEENKPSSRGK